MALEGMRMDIGEHLQKMRENRNVSVYRLSQLSSISESHIRNLEKGKKQPTFYTLKKLLDCLNISLSEFFCEDPQSVLYPSADEAELIVYYRSLDSKKAKALLEFCKAMSE